MRAKFCIISRAAAALGLVLLAGGCALTSKATPVDIRFFTIDLATSAPSAAPSAVSDDARARVAAPKLRLGRITSSAFLRNPIVIRRTSYEVGTYEDCRWTEYPEEYLRRSLALALFDEGRFVQGLGGRVTTLDIELLAFEDVVRGARHSGRVQLGYRLHDELLVLDTGIITVERNVASGGGIDAVVAAIAGALDEATTRVSDAAAASLSRPPSATATSAR